MTSVEQQLWNAVLIQAYTDLTDRKEKIQDDARRWFANPGMGLEEICRAVGVSVTRARSRAIFILRHRRGKTVKKWFAARNQGKAR